MKTKLKIGVAIFLAILSVSCASAFLIKEQTTSLVEPTAIINASSNSSDIKLVQKKLKNWGYYKGSVDGIYGSKTKQAVILFQKRNGLVADGIVGNKTLSAMGISQSMLSGTTSSKPNQSSGVNGYTSADVQLLARLIHAEARGESYTGQVAVGAVVLNRVRSSSFPNTISGVIYQPYAFTCVNDGQINLKPNSTALSAAKDAMNGWDPTYGCLYYYNPKIATNQWIFSRPTVVTIGNHVFAS
ncbi:MAG: spore cortex-lytic enzyme [Clostridia bacterium]|nr:spore cortex-lytic enzyme [Clostridia bacterium]